MIMVRATAKLLKKLKSDKEENPPKSTGILGDWYCDIAIIQKQHLILCVSQRTLLPIILPAKDPASFPKRLRSALDVVLTKIGVSKKDIDAELVEMEDVVISKTASRQILGSMSDFLHILDAMLDHGAPLDQMTWHLGDTPCSPLGMSSPLEETAKVFGVGPVPLKKAPTQLKLIKSE